MIVGFYIMKERRPLGLGPGQVKHGMKSDESRNLPNTRGEPV
jgi:hypothetical protein